MKTFNSSLETKVFISNYFVYGLNGIVVDKFGSLFEGVILLKPKHTSDTLVKQ